MKYLLFIYLLILPGMRQADVKKINLYITIAEECPICNYMGKPLARLAESYKDEVNLYVVFPLRNSNYKTIHRFKEKYGLQSFESILDKDQSLTKKLGATVTPEAIITDENQEVLYRGRIDDTYFAPGKIRHGGAKKYDLKNALDNILNGRTTSRSWPKAVGCYITFYE